MFKYYINEILSQDKDFLDFLSDSTISFFKSEHCITLFQNKESELKYFMNNDLVYLFLQKNNQIQVLIKEIYSFEMNKDIQEIINYNEEKFNNGQKIYSSEFIFNCDFEQTKPNFTEEELNDLNYLSNLLSEIKKKENLDELLSKYKLYLDELTSFNKKEKKVFSENTLNIYNYLLLLNSFGYKDENYDSDFFVQCLIRTIPNFVSYADDITIKFNSLNEIVKTHKFKFDNRYSFNDCDNHLFSTKYGFIFSDQAFNFYVHFIDKENFTVFIIDNYEGVKNKIKNVENMIKNNNYNLLNDIVLKIEDNKMTYVNSLHFQSRFYDDLKFTIESLESENLLKVSYPIDIHSYQYQRDYFCHTYKQTELNFLI